MASRFVSILATFAIVAAMVAPALAQSSGGSTGTGSAPATGSGSSTPKTPPAPSATQPGMSKQPSTATPGSSSDTTQPGVSAGNTSKSSKSTTGMNDGADSEQVKAIQKALQDKGMDPGPIDGVMGPKTMAALKAFQKDQKLPESGRLDDQTREKLGVSR
jgi:His-Xaa-Ser repeat protein HxsA